jgi:DNA-binding NtrC family response regulator
MNHVLIVDDEADIRESLEAILREEDYVITTAGTAAEALELLRDADYQAVLLDIWLSDPGGDPASPTASTSSPPSAATSRTLPAPALPKSS